MSDNNKTKKRPLKITLIIAACLFAVTIIAMIVSSSMKQAQQNWLNAENSKIAKENQELENQFELLKSEYEKNNTKVEANDWPLPKQDGWDIIDLKNFPLQNPETMTVGRDELLKSGLLLINPWHSIPKDYENLISNSLVSIGTATSGKIAVQDYNLKLFPEAINALQDMFAAAAQEGLGDYIIREAFRSNADQTVLFENTRTKLAEKFSGDILIEETKKSVNYPGTSEYQSGLAIRVALYNKEKPDIANMKLQETDQGKWLTENCWKYGYVFRFPIQDFPDSSWEDKSYITGVSVKLNAYRYVGQAAAEIMHLKNLVLEEFIEYMVEHPHIAVYENGILKYELYRKPVETQNASLETIEKPASAIDVISSYDNMGGIISIFVY